MTDTLTDAAVVMRVLDGDVEAFGVLVDRYQDEFAGYAKYMTGSADEAADVVQDSMVRAFKALRRCREPARFKAWLFRIVSNQCKTHLARRARRGLEPLSDQSAELLAPHDPGADAEAADVRRRVHAALQDLPVEQREVLVLRYVEGLGLDEIAGLVSASVSALKMRLLRGRKALREKLRGIAA